MRTMKINPAILISFCILCLYGDEDFDGNDKDEDNVVAMYIFLLTFLIIPSLR